MTKALTFGTIAVALALTVLYGVNALREANVLGASTSRTTVSNPWTFSGAVIHSALLTATGATRVQEFTQGGGICTLTDANGGTYTLTQAEMAACNILHIPAQGVAQEVIALTLPATSTLTTLLPTIGDYREWLIDASDLAAATTTTVTAAAGIDLLAVTNAEDIIDGGESSELRCWRKWDTDIACITSELINSD